MSNWGFQNWGKFIFRLYTNFYSCLFKFIKKSRLQFKNLRKLLWEYGLCWATRKHGAWRQLTIAEKLFLPSFCAGHFVLKVSRENSKSTFWPGNEGWRYEASTTYNVRLAIRPTTSANGVIIKSIYFDPNFKFWQVQILSKGLLHVNPWSSAYLWS